MLFDGSEQYKNKKYNNTLNANKDKNNSVADILLIFIINPSINKTITMGYRDGRNQTSLF
jgi:hypothetical protein